MPASPPLVSLIGPTASGKTSLSLVLAKRFNGEIVNCDSVAMYREFLVGTAKPTVEEQAGAPHHLLDVIEPEGYTTAGEYARMARKVIQEISRRGALPIVVGGTGLYLRALLEGLFPGPERSENLRQRLRERAQKNGSQYLHRVLARLDRNLASNIHENDVPKMIRAVEVCLTAKTPMSEQWKAGREPLSGLTVHRIGLDPDRSLLYERINNRVQKMFDTGLVEETEQLLSRYGKAARPLESIGYKQVVRMLKGEMDRDGAIRAVQQAHRNYAKRQMTWFRREREVHWIRGFGDEPETIAAAIEEVEKHLPSYP